MNGDWIDHGGTVFHRASEPCAQCNEEKAMAEVINTHAPIANAILNNAMLKDSKVIAWCAKCSRPPDSLESATDTWKKCFVVRAYCHGEWDEKTVTFEQLENAAHAQTMWQALTFFNIAAELEPSLPEPQFPSQVFSVSTMMPMMVDSPGGVAKEVNVVTSMGIADWPMVGSSSFGVSHGQSHTAIGKPKARARKPPEPPPAAVSEEKKPRLISLEDEA